MATLENTPGKCTLPTPGHDVGGMEQRIPIRTKNQRCLPLVLLHTSPVHEKKPLRADHASQEASAGVFKASLCPRSSSNEFHRYSTHNAQTADHYHEA